jgi:diguanylate cyclase (GGDEF)-like protein
MAESQLSGQELLAQQRGARNSIVQLVRAIAGLGISYLVARWITGTMFEYGPINGNQVTVEVTVYLLVASVALTISNIMPIRRDLERITRVVDDNERTLREQGRTQRFQRDVHNAFEMAEHESELYEVAGGALTRAGDVRAEILVADASRAHVHRAVVAADREPPGCGVTTPGSCPAVRSGQTLRFDEPNGFASCPRLRERELPEGSVATCIPITILGAPTAVLHSIHDDGHDQQALHESITQLEGMGISFGTRLGMLRAMAQSQLQADTDPLTGLLNRRAMENKIRQLRSEGLGFALAMADLDHFKHLNDTFGHDTGDRALRLFARVVSNAVRDSDLVSRHGGEEFVIVLPGADVTTAAPVLHRIRANLADSIGAAQVPPFTVSIGLVDSTWSSDLLSLLRSADRALSEAKEQGRDRVIIDHTSEPLDDTAAPMPTAISAQLPAPVIGTSIR